MITTGPLTTAARAAAATPAVRGRLVPDLSKLEIAAARAKLAALGLRTTVTPVTTSERRAGIDRRPGAEARQQAREGLDRDVVGREGARRPPLPAARPRPPRRRRPRPRRRPPPRPLRHRRPRRFPTSRTRTRRARPGARAGRHPREPRVRPGLRTRSERSWSRRSRPGRPSRTTRTSRSTSRAARRTTRSSRCRT